MPAQHVLYSFRRCPYAIRTRMALSVAGISYEHREVVLRDKPAEMLLESPKGTVPVMILHDQYPAQRTVLEESTDIMRWALEQHDPENWRPDTPAAQAEVDAWLARFEAEFKPNLDAYKYGRTKTEDDIAQHDRARTACESVLLDMNERLIPTGYLFGNSLGYADIGAFPFVRQYANVNLSQFNSLDIESLKRWLDALLTSSLFLDVMQKYEQWQSESNSQ